MTDTRIEAAARAHRRCMQASARKGEHYSEIVEERAARAAVLAFLKEAREPSEEEGKRAWLFSEKWKVSKDGCPQYMDPYDAWQAMLDQLIAEIE